MQPRVTAIIPTYNRAYALTRTVDSVLAQTYANCDALIVDDGSTDDTRGVLAGHYGGNPRVQYVRKRNGGVSSARNVGLERADGDYVAFLDSDDAWKPWKVELQIACLRRLPGVEMIWTDMDIVDAAGTVLREKGLRQRYTAYQNIRIERELESSRLLRELVPEVPDPQGDTRVYWGDGYSAIVMGQLCLTSTVLLSRSRAKATGLFDEAMKSGEDYDYHLRAIREGPVAFLDIASTLYRLGAADQLTHRSYHAMIAENTLRTLSRTIARDRSRIRASSFRLRRKLAEIHRWVGEERLELRDNRGAREHFAKSLAQWPCQLRTWALLGAVCGGPGFTDAVRLAYRTLRGRDGT